MATKKKVGSKAKARSRKVAPSRKQGPYAYTVNLVDGDRRIVIDGLNDGNIYGRRKQLVTFNAGEGVPPFTLTATRLVRNDSKKRKNLKKEWPFKGDEPAWPRREFAGKLRSPGLFKKAIYKYTISIEGKVAADPIIIIDR
jgi:hypothetical protein